MSEILEFLLMIFGSMKVTLLSSLIILQVSKEELREMMEESVLKIASKIPKRRTQPYTKKEVRDLFQVTYPTIYAWEEKGYLERIQKGGRVYYTAESVESYYHNQ